MRWFLWRRRGCVLGALAYGGIVLVNTLVLAQLTPSARGDVLQVASTNQQRLESSHLGTLASSALFAQNPPAAYLASVVIILCAAGLVLGGPRLFGLFVLGHVGATLMVFGLLAVDAVPGVSADAVRTVVDVGPSYGLVASVAAAGVLVARHPRRIAVVAGTVVIVLVGVDIVRPSVAHTGHVLASALGLAAGAVLLRRGRRSEMEPGRPVLSPGAAPLLRRPEGLL